MSSFLHELAALKYFHFFQEKLGCSLNEPIRGENFQFSILVRNFPEKRSEANVVKSQKLLLLFFFFEKYRRIINYLIKFPSLSDTRVLFVELIEYFFFQLTLGNFIFRSGGSRVKKNPQESRPPSTPKPHPFSSPPSLLSIRYTSASFSFSPIPRLQWAWGGDESGPNSEIRPYPPPRLKN